MFLTISFAIRSIVPPAPLKPQTMFSFQHSYTHESGTTATLHTATPLLSTGTVCYSGYNVRVSWEASVQVSRFARQSHWLCSLRQMNVTIACCDARFKAHRDMDVYHLQVLCAVSRDLCDRLITHPEYYQTWCVLSIIMKPQ